jgi:O-succinylbenzoic acid--CoA ligase
VNELSILAAGREPGTASRVALVVGGAAITYAELGARVLAAMQELAARGVSRGTRVALVASNRIETVVFVHALIELGATLVPIHPRFTPQEAAVIVANVAPCIELSDRDLEAGSGSGEPPRAQLTPDDPLAIVHTSGTTGRPKGAVLSHGAFVASARANAVNLGISETDRWLLCMPICHIGGLSILTRCLIARATVVLEPRFDPHTVLALLERNDVTLLSVVPTMLRSLVDEDRNGALARPRAILVGGAATPIAWLDECAARRIPAITTYGLTEACSQVTAQRLTTRLRGEPGSGPPLPGVEIRIVTDDGSLAPVGEIGRIHVRGPNVMTGYYGLPSPLLDGWLETGDLGSIAPDGALFVHARRTDLIVTGGENVYPAEVEAVIESCPGVRSALVFGVPDERWGALVAAAIVPADRESFDLDALESELGARLAQHKRPRRVAIASELPVTAGGKIDRRAALDRFGRELVPFFSRERGARGPIAPPPESGTA